MSYQTTRAIAAFGIQTDARGIRSQAKTFLTLASTVVAFIFFLGCTDSVAKNKPVADSDTGSYSASVGLGLTIEKPSAELLNRIQRDYPKLVRLHIRRNHTMDGTLAIDDNYFRELMSLPHLRYLVVEDGSALTSASIDMAERNPKLRFVEIANARWFGWYNDGVWPTERKDLTIVVLGSTVYMDSEE